MASVNIIKRSCEDGVIIEGVVGRVPLLCRNMRKKFVSVVVRRMEI
jgi:hypothetical protein